MTYADPYSTTDQPDDVDPSPSAGVAMLVAGAVIAVILGLIHHYSPWMF